MDITALAQLGGTVTTVALFIWYLMHKNSKAEKAQNQVADALNRVHDAQERHTKVLIRIMPTAQDKDDLMNI